MLKLLCIDDEQGILDTIGVLCKRIGLDYEYCNSGKDAVQLFKRKDYDTSK